MTIDDLQEEVDRLAEDLGRSVAIDDPRMLLIVASRHFGDEDQLRVHSILNRSVPDEVREHVLAYGVATWWKPGRIPGDSRLGYTERVCIPLRYDSDLLGFLWLIDPGRTMTDGALATVLAASATIAELIQARSGRSKSVDNAPGDLAHALIDGNADERRRAAEHLSASHHDASSLVAVAARSQGNRPEAALHTAFTTQARDHCAVVLPSVRGRTGYALISFGSCHAGHEPAEAAREVHAALCVDAGPGAHCFVGVSAAGHGWDSAPALHRQANEVLTACQVRGRPVLTWGELGADPLLLQLLDAGMSRPWPGEDIVDRLVSERGTALLDTAEAYVGCAGDARMAANRLHVHRSTLYYRLRRIEEVAGLDLGSGADRLVLQIAVRLHRLRQESQSQ